MAKISKQGPRKAPKQPSPDPSSEDEDSENGGIDDEGMAKLMEALGDDGLDEFDQAQLAALGEDGEEDEWSTEDEEGDGEDIGNAGDVQGGSESESESDEDDGPGEDVAMDDVQGSDDEDVALDDVDSVDEDAVPKQKIEVDNKIALERIRETIQLDPSLPWTETLVLSYPHTIDVDVNDDLNRELAFYKQALHGATTARTLAAKHAFPFTRPADYFAEMVKTDAHMERIRQRLLDESAGIKKSEDKRKEREGKKFGKQVQIEKIKEREKSKKEMEERLKGLKRKRKDVLDNPQGGDTDFDIAVEDAISERGRPAKRARGSGRGGGKQISRDSRDKKFGFGGSGRRSKSNTKESTDDFDSGPGKRGGRGGARGGARGRGGGRGGARGGSGRGGGGGGRGGKRLGKSRRVDARSRG